MVTSSLRLSPSPLLPLVAVGDDDGTSCESLSVALCEDVDAGVCLEASGVFCADEEETSVLVEIGEEDLLVKTGYMVERSTGGGAEKVSLVGLEQLAEPSGLLLQQYQRCSWSL